MRDILVIDDEPMITRAVEKICRADGLSVAVAEDASTALGCLDGTVFHLVLCDIMMNGLDGFQFLEELTRKGIETPVVMMTGYSTVENAVRSLSTGNAIDYIPKPFTADELLSVVWRGLRYSKLTTSANAADPPSDRTMSYTPCPANYHQLGYVSWVLMEKEGTAKVGVNDLFLRVMEGVRELELHLPGEELVQGATCAVATARDDSVHHIMCPMGGKVLEINMNAQSTPSLVEDDPYSTGWLYRILPTDPESDLKWLTSRMTKETAVITA
jgi:DNA-binding response OmpR family regulator